jgi:hypothetical protein
MLRKYGYAYENGMTAAWAGMFFMLYSEEVSYGEKFKRCFENV